MARTTTRSMSNRATARTRLVDRFPSVSVLLLVGLLGVLVLMGVGGAVLFAIGPAHAGKPGAVVPRDALGPLAALPAMEFTLADDRSLRTVNLKVTLEFPPGTDAQALAASVPRVAMAVNSRMIEVQPEDLSGAAGTGFVKQQVSIAVNRELRPLKVRTVMLQHFLVR